MTEINNARYVAIDHNGEVLLLQMYDEDIRDNKYKQVWRISKSNPDAQLRSMLNIFLSITKHEGFDKEGLYILARISQLEELVDMDMLQQVLGDYRMKVHKTLDNWIAERDFGQYRIMGGGETPIRAIINMKRIGTPR